MKNKKREIKFRALVKPKKKNDLPFWIYYKTLEIPIRTKNFDSFIVKDLQYTSLKDKNGKEIWEGNILHFKGNVYSGTPGEFDKKDMILPVVYKDNKGFQMYLIGFCYYEIYSHEVEVIGNIFENKELLKRIADWKHL